MKFSEKLLKNYECKKMTVVRRDDGDYCIFSTLDFQGDLKATGWFGSVERALKSIGGIMGWEYSPTCPQRYLKAEETQS